MTTEREQPDTKTTAQLAEFDRLCAESAQGPALRAAVARLEGRLGNQTGALADMTRVAVARANDVTRLEGEVERRRQLYEGLIHSFKFTAEELETARRERDALREALEGEGHGSGGLHVDKKWCPGCATLAKGGAQ